MAEKALSISEARKQFSHLVDGVSRGSPPVTITQHGKERAALIGIREYQELTKKAQAFDRSRKKTKPFTLRGSLELCCSPKELVDEMRRIRAMWAESIQRSFEDMAREMTGK